MSDPCAAGVFNSVPPPQTWDLKLTVGGTNSFGDIRKTEVSFCSQNTVQEAVGRLSGVDATATATACNGASKSKSGEKDVYIISVIKSNECDTVATKYVPGGSISGDTLTLTYQQEQGGPGGAGDSPGEWNFILQLKCKQGGPDKWDSSTWPNATASGNSWTQTGDWVGACKGHTFSSSGGDAAGSGGGAFGIAIIVILLVGIVLYVGGMVGYNKFKLQKEGRELAPHPDFWTAVPGYLKDGHKFVFAKVTGKGGSSEYSSV